MLFTVNTEVCTRCGLCVADCPTGLLVMTDDGPKTGKGGCISCGHCVAVCPTLALDSDLTPRAEQVDITKETKFTPEQAELFLRSRRSIRNYQNKPVPAELIRKVLNAGEAEYEPLLELLGVPDDKIIAGGILMGYPKVRYRNIVERQPLDVTFDTEE